MAEACAAPHSRNLKMVDLVERERQEWIWWKTRWWRCTRSNARNWGVRRWQVSGDQNETPANSINIQLVENYMDLISIKQQFQEFQTRTWIRSVLGKPH